MTTAQRGTDGRFLPGHGGGPGRPVGSRQKLSEDFLRKLQSDFEGHGLKAIENARAEDPMGYVRVIAGLLPKAVKLDASLERVVVVDFAGFLEEKGEFIEGDDDIPEWEDDGALHDPLEQEKLDAPNCIELQPEPLETVFGIDSDNPGALHTPDGALSTYTPTQRRTFDVREDSDDV